MHKDRTDNLVVSYSLGVDSTAVLIGLHQRGITPRAIVFADVGSEKSATYAYKPVIDAWLMKVGFPPITVVKNPAPRSPYSTIEGNMVMNATLPGATFGMGSCTLKWKVDPQNKWARKQTWIAARWAQGLKVSKAIGFEAEEGYRTTRACDKQHADKNDAKRWDYWYPLQDWGWTREHCITVIEAAGLPVPVKSACFFCPNCKPEEIVELTAEERGRIVRMEVRAEPYNRKVQGLWRRKRKRDGRPGSITEYILEEGLTFTDPQVLDATDPMPLSDKCQKFTNGRTFKKDGDDIYLSVIVEEHCKKSDVA